MKENHKGDRIRDEVLIISSVFNFLLRKNIEKASNRNKKNFFGRIKLLGSTCLSFRKFGDVAVNEFLTNLVKLAKK